MSNKQDSVEFRVESVESSKPGLAQASGKNNEPCFEAVGASSLKMLECF